jgi:hypothetical protein
MGEPFLTTTTSETKAWKRAAHFELRVSNGLHLERVLTLREGSILQLGLWWVVVRPRFDFLPAGRSSRKSSQKVCCAQFFDGEQQVAFELAVARIFSGMRIYFKNI